MPSDPIRLFESLAAATWDRIRFGEELDCPQQEETITDINLLDLKRARLANVHVRKVSRKREARTGLDWEWWIGSDRTGWWRYAVQAKKMDQSGRYDLRKKVRKRGQFQLRILEEYARLKGCVPLYCLYNFSSLPDNSPYWNCNLSYDEPQFGCTVARLDVVKQAFRKRKPKTFEALHLTKGTVPWRCLIRCPLIVPATNGRTHPLVTESFSHLTPHETLPDSLRADVSADDPIELPPFLYGDDMGVYPERILVVDVGIYGADYWDSVR